VGPPLAAGIATLAAAVGLLVAWYTATHRGTAFRERRDWLVGAPMVFSGVGFIVVGAIVLPGVPIAGVLIAGWGLVEIAMVAILLARSRRSDRPKPGP
jgi:hypothetical protein